jgi:hypothetical protein
MTNANQATTVTTEAPRANAGHFTKTRIFSQFDQLDHLKAGQWVQTDTGARGQYLGKTEQGAQVINWVKNGKFDTKMALSNSPLRKFAKINGSK